MANVNYNNIFVKKIIQNRVMQHTLFWSLSFFVLLNIFAYGDHLIKADYIYATLFHIPLVLVVYFNLRFLLPKFLSKKRYWFYFILIVPTLSMIAWFSQFMFERLVDYIFPGYFFISYFEFQDYALFTLIYLSVSTLLKMSKGWFELMETQQQLNQLKEENLNTELRALKSQINPHFLFNSLNSIYALSLDNDVVTPKIILKLSELLRFMLYETSEEKVDLEKEIHHLENYIDLQKLRVSEKAAIRFEKEGDFEDLKIAPLLLLPLVENGFKHGIKGDVENAFIVIFSKIENNEFTFSVKNNNGIVDEVEDDKYKGIGLKNVKRRLSLLYPEKHDLKIEADEKTFLVSLRIQL
jgi:sensor histidine kinase YesM